MTSRADRRPARRWLLPALFVAGVAALGALGLCSTLPGPLLIDHDVILGDDELVLYVAAPSHCTAAAVGPQTLLTAAHCLSDDRRCMDARLTLGTRGGGRIASCTCQVDRDLALCVITTGKPFPNGRLETLAAAGTAPAVGDRLVLTGYGCLSWNCGRRVGYGRTVPRAGCTTVAGVEPGFFVTDGRRNRDCRSALCPGDSGGPVFVTRSAAGAVTRSVVAVASEGCEGGDVKRSRVASVVDTTARDWMCAWLRAAKTGENRSIKGLSCPP